MCVHPHPVPTPHDFDAIEVPSHHNQVNNRMINRFYHDTSYQKYDNKLAIFIKRVPRNITQSKLCGVLRAHLLRYCEQNRINHYDNIEIDYVDINYHKQFAFVYLGNIETFAIALEMQHIFIGRNICQIEQKRSNNEPRKFVPNKKNNR